MPMLAVKHQLYYNIPLPQFETDEHANEDSLQAGKGWTKKDAAASRA
jgi:hypothetical protein